MRRVERWIFTAGTAERLAFLRIGLCAVLTLRLMRGIFLDLAGQPDALFEPRSFMNLLGSQPSRGAVLAIQVAGLVAGVCATIGLYARTTLPVAWAASVFLNAMVTSNGKIMHNDVMLLLALVPLLAAPVSDAWSIDARRRGIRPPGAVAYGWPVRTAMIVVAGGYFFTGLAKLVHSGPAWFTSDNLRWVLYISSDSQGTPNDLALFVADRAWLAHLMAFGTLALEGSFPVLLFRPRLAMPYAFGAAGLHAGIWLTMRLNYVVWAATALIVLVDWPEILVRERLQPRRPDANLELHRLL
ncbi:MAG: hypothetical protein ACRDJ1_13195 [Actinomycetota bacterium]